MKYSSATSRPSPKLDATSRTTSALGFEAPADSSRQRTESITRDVAHLPRATEERNLWKACALFPHGPHGGDLLEIRGSPREAGRLIDRLRGRDFHATGVAKNSKFHTRKSKLSKPLKDFRPVAKISALKTRISHDEEFRSI